MLQFLALRIFYRPGLDNNRVCAAHLTLASTVGVFPINFQTIPLTLALSRTLNIPPIRLQQGSSIKNQIFSKISCRRDQAHILTDPYGSLRISSCHMGAKIENEFCNPSTVSKRGSNCSQNPYLQGCNCQSPTQHVLSSTVLRPLSCSVNFGS